MGNIEIHFALRENTDSGVYWCEFKGNKELFVRVSGGILDKNK